MDNMVTNTFINTFITLVQINLCTKLTVKLTVINSFNTSVQQYLASTGILDNAKKW
jgi:hypothetical protein